MNILMGAYSEEYLEPSSHSGHCLAGVSELGRALVLSENCGRPKKESLVLTVWRTLSGASGSCLGARLSCSDRVNSKETSFQTLFLWTGSKEKVFSFGLVQRKKLFL